MHTLRLPMQEYRCAGRGCRKPNLSATLARYSCGMFRPPVLAAIALVVAPVHANAPHVIERSGFELSDLAMFVVAAGGVWFARAAMRRRKRNSED